ncbi:MAG: leucine-rich repeat protein [Clostridia bacterium]|nr:leucine-rich repeat protein [Clostridia bacterium]
MQSKKLITSISMICLMAILLIVGVWALTEVQFKVGGDIEYIVPVPEPTPVEDVSYLTFSYDNTAMTASVTDCDTSVTSAEIPSIILYNGNTYIVTSIYDASRYNKGVFYNCKSLESVTVPNSVISIGSWAFYD